MMLGTSPGVGADAFLAASNARGLSPAGRSPVPSPGTGARAPPRRRRVRRVRRRRRLFLRDWERRVDAGREPDERRGEPHGRASTQEQRSSPSFPALAPGPGPGPAVVTGFDLAASSAAETTCEGSRVSPSARGMSAIATSATTREEAARKATQRSTPRPPRAD